jgi:ubiquinol-cytochrome c reductase cytochrome c1 subunit
MVRIIAFLAGLGFCAALLIAAFMPRDAVEETATELFHKEHKEVSFSSDGPLGKFDRPQLQRGLQVYKRFNDLTKIGYTAGQVKTIAAEFQVPSINADTGEAASRPGLASDNFPSPYPNEVAARAANNGAAPPDLSLMTKAREGYAPYVYSLLTGYQHVPANLPKEARPDATHYYNPYFASLNIAMPPPLTTTGQVTYGPGNPPATVDQMAKDVTAFLIWTAEPKLENRHRAGVASLIFLLVFAGLCWGSYKSIWANKPH